MKQFKPNSTNRIKLESISEYGSPQLSNGIRIKKDEKDKIVEIVIEEFDPNEAGSSYPTEPGSHHGGGGGYNQGILIDSHSGHHGSGGSNGDGSDGSYNQNNNDNNGSNNNNNNQNNQNNQNTDDQNSIGKGDGNDDKSDGRSDG